MSDNVTNALIYRTLQDVQASLARLEATSTRLEKASVRHDRKFDEHLQRFSAVEARISAVEASVHDAKDELESIIKIELGGQIGNTQAQLGHRIDELAERLAALEAAGVPPG